MRLMIQAAHVRRDCPEPWIAARHSAAGELSRWRQGQEPHAEEPLGLAGRADRAAARRAARRCAGTGGRGAGDRARSAARACACRARHGAADQARSAAAARRRAPRQAGLGADRGTVARSGVQAGDGTGARRDDGAAFARRDARARGGDGQGGLRDARLARSRAGGH